MDPAVQGALIAAISALGGAGLASGVNIWIESRRQKAQERQEASARAHEQRQQRYDERKRALEDFYTELIAAERDTLQYEERNGILPGDADLNMEYRAVDAALARLHFLASDDCLAAAEECASAFYAWGWSGATHTRLYEAMNEFLKAVRVDLDVNVSGYTRPLPKARTPKQVGSRLSEN